MRFSTTLILFIVGSRIAAAAPPPAASDAHNSAYWQAFTELKLADFAPAEYVASAQSSQVLGKAIERLKTAKVADVRSVMRGPLGDFLQALAGRDIAARREVSQLLGHVTSTPLPTPWGTVLEQRAREWLAIHDLNEAETFIYINELGQVYSVHPFAPFNRRSLSEGEVKVANVRWLDPGTQNSFALKNYRVQIVNAQNENYIVSRTLLTTGSDDPNYAKYTEAPTPKLVEPTAAHDLLIRNLDARLSDLVDAVNSNGYKTNNDHAITYSALVRAIARIKELFADDLKAKAVVLGISAQLIKP